jgi:hypothetical protein
VIVADDKVAIIRQQRAEQAAQQQQMAMMPQMADAMSKLGNVKTDEETLASDVMAGLQGYST